VLSFRIKDLRCGQVRSLRNKDLDLKCLIIKELAAILSREGSVTGGLGLNNPSDWEMC
jgi:hypothetical protein